MSSVAYCDNTGEVLAQQVRPRSAGCNDTADNIGIFQRAVEQIPGPNRTQLLFRRGRVLCGLLAWIASAGGRRHPSYTWTYSAGWTFIAREMDAVRPVDALERDSGRTLWEPAVQSDGTIREKAFMVEATSLLGDLSTWPPGTGSSYAANPCIPATPSTPAPTNSNTGCA
ncbi:hypothetical protein ACFV16_37950 [Streptomyces massasporeus]|uniref:hypothetical protein n=1 Tax=Streptomyces massasporeus TaxID=67324 RepID=UPI0036CC0EF4